MSKKFRRWQVDDVLLLPPSVTDFVPAGHFSHFVRDVVRERLDLSAITGDYREARGYPPYDPRMMTALLLYAYCQGVYSSRRMARSWEERLDVMAVTAMNRPDFRTISDFRKRHLAALGGLLVQVLRLCRAAGLVKLGHVALDGTRIKGNASKHRAMSYGRMKKAEAAAKDAAAAGGPPKGRTERPGGKPKTPPGTPKDSAQRNFTDADSRIRKTKDGTIQGYNAQAAVDAAHRVIVAHGLGNNASDQEHLAPMVDAIETNTGGTAKEFSADAGYCSEATLEVLEPRRINAYVATGRQKHGRAAAVGDTKGR